MYGISGMYDVPMLPCPDEVNMEPPEELREELKGFYKDKLIPALHAYYEGEVVLTTPSNLVKWVAQDLKLAGWQVKTGFTFITFFKKYPIQRQYFNQTKVMVISQFVVAVVGMLAAVGSFTVLSFICGMFALVLAISADCSLRDEIQRSGVNK